MHSAVLENNKQIIFKEKLVAIIRVEDPDDIMPIVSYLDEAGVRVLEITSNTPCFQDYVPIIKQQYPHLMVGVGTVTNQFIAKKAISAGAEFLVTPNVCEQVITTAHKFDLPVMVGAFTPTDIVNAANYGADVIKLFPAEPFGPEHYNALANGPFLDLPLFPVGGIDETNAEDYIKLGAKGMGIGGSLVTPVRSQAHRKELIKRNQQLLKLLQGTDA